MLVSLTVGKVDAGVAVLLTQDKRLIEFPSILLPPDIHSGSIVDINVSRNQPAESITEQKFAALQAEVLATFGAASPAAPVLRCRNATQTSVVLEWDPIAVATAELRGLSLWRNGGKVGAIPPGKGCTKVSGLAVDTAYTFHLVLRTSAGQYASERLAVRTHRLTDLSGLTITPGVLPPPLRDSLAETVRRIGAKLVDTVRIDTTHLVCTEARGPAWEKAVEMNVPVVVPDWVKGCEREGRVVGVRSYYLDANPKDRQMGPPSGVPAVSGRTGSQGAGAMASPRIETTPPTPERATSGRGRDAETGAAPAPPPKGQDTASVGSTASPGGTTLAGQHPHEERDADEDEDEDEGEGEGEGEGKKTEGSEADDDSLSATGHDGGEDGASREGIDEDKGRGEEEGNFDEVALE